MQGMTALAFWLAASFLGPSDFGRFSAAMGVAVLLLTTIDFGINSATIRDLARTPDQANIFRETLGAKCVVSGLIAAVWILACIGLALTNSYWYSIAPLGLYILLSDITSTLNVIPLSQQRMQTVSAVMIAQKTTTLFSIIALHLIGMQSSYALTVGFAMGSAVSVIVAWRYLDGISIDWEDFAPSALRRLWINSYSFGLASLSSQIQRLDVPLVALISGPLAAGVYAAPARITNTLIVIPTALSTTLFPKLSASNTKKAMREGFCAIVATTLVSLLPMACLFVLADPIVSILLGSDYAQSAEVLRFIVIGTAFTCLNVPVAAMLQAVGDERYVARAIGVSSLLGLLVVAMGSYLRGAPGASIGWIVLQFLVAILLFSRLVNRMSSDETQSVGMEEGLTFSVKTQRDS